MSHTRASHQVTIMRRSFPAALAAAFLLFLPPLVPAAAQTGRDSTSERTEARAQRERERERERAERAERIAERVRERMESRDDADDDRDAAQGGMQGRTSIDTTVPFARGGVVDLSLISGEIREKRIPMRPARSAQAISASPLMMVLQSGSWKRKVEVKPAPGPSTDCTPMPTSRT